MIWLIYCKLNLNSHVSPFFFFHKGGRGKKKKFFHREHAHLDSLQFTAPLKILSVSPWRVLGAGFPSTPSGPPPHSTSRPIRVESGTTVGFCIVNISLTRWPASLGDYPAFSLQRWSCCSNWWPRSEWSRCASHLSPDSSHSPDWASHHCDSPPKQSHQLPLYPTISGQTLFFWGTFSSFPVCEMGPQLSLNNFPLSKNISVSAEHRTHCANPWFIAMVTAWY